ncbi:MAG: hypothetical protein ABF257_05630 [Polaribacter sp.]
MATKKTKKAENKIDDICFTIMPFGGWFDKYYEEIYSPAITNAGLLPKRADDLYRPSNIVNDIWDYTKNAKIILADLTNKNPNVFYELGLAHAITKPAILITQSMEDIPFDLRSLRIIQYDKNSPNWGEILQTKIEKAIEEIIESPEKAIPPTFLEISDIHKTKISQDKKELLDIKNELNMLKREVRSPRLRKRSSDIITRTEAEIELRKLIESDIPEDIIVDALLDKGVPNESWIRENYKIFKSKINEDS